MKKTITILVLVFAFKQMSFAQSMPTSADALKILKEYNYDDYVAKKAGCSVSQVKITKANYSGIDNGKLLEQSNVAKKNYWGNDILEYYFDLASPKDKDGVSLKYTIIIQYKHSRCLTNGGCYYLNQWEFEKTIKFGPKVSGTTELNDDFKKSLFLDIINSNSENLKSDSGLPLDDFYIIDSIFIPSPNESSVYKEKVYSKTSRLIFVSIIGKKQLYGTGDDFIVFESVEKRLNYKIRIKLVGKEWTFDKFEYSNWDKVISRAKKPTKVYQVLKNSNFANIYQTKTELDYPMESCFQARKFYKVLEIGLQKFSTGDDSEIRKIYATNEDYNTDKQVVDFLINGGYSINIDSANFSCNSYGVAKMLAKFNFKFTHPKFKGKLEKQLEDYGIHHRLANQLYKGKGVRSLDIEMVLVQNQWKIKSWYKELTTEW